MILEPELRQLFRAEAQENLTRLEQGLLELEQRPEDRSLLDLLFRNAHSLKGSAASLNLIAIESLAHQFEDRLEAARQGRKSLQPGETEGLYLNLDQLKRLVEEASASPKEVPEEIPVAEATPIPPVVRVDIQRLDRLLGEVGDLVVTSARMRLRTKEVEQILSLQENLGHGAEVTRQLERLLQVMHEDQMRLVQATERLREDVGAIRLLPFSTLFQRFPRLVRDLAQQQSKEVELIIEGGETGADRSILENLYTPLVHLLRNAIDHGVETPRERTQKSKPRKAQIRLSAVRQGATLEVVLRDDGSGIDLETIRQQALRMGLFGESDFSGDDPPDLKALLFAPGFSTRRSVTALSGRGVGLNVVRSEVERMRGHISVESVPGQGTTFHLRLPQSLTTSQVLLLRSGGALFGVPLSQVEQTLCLETSTVVTSGGRVWVDLQGRLTPLFSLNEILRTLPNAKTRGEHCLVVQDMGQGLALEVDEILQVGEILIKPIGESPLINGAAILADGTICLVLQVAELIRVSAQRTTHTSNSTATGARILAADDSPSSRQRLCQVLEVVGYRPTLAKDGLEAWKLLHGGDFAAVVCQLELPGLDGLELTRRIRQNPEFKNLPVILLTSQEDPEHRLAGLEAGANLYLHKRSLDDGILKEMLERIL